MVFRSFVIVSCRRGKVKRDFALFSRIKSQQTRERETHKVTISLQNARKKRLKIIYFMGNLSKFIEFCCGIGYNRQELADKKMDIA